MKTFAICILLCFNFTIFSQDYFKGILIFKIKSDAASPLPEISNNQFVKDERLNSLFKKYSVVKYYQAYPFSDDNESLKDYKVEFDGNDEDFITDLTNNVSDIVYAIKRFEIPISSYDPSDELWDKKFTGSGLDSLWHLKIIQADKAWDITKSNPKIKIAVIDNDFDTLHPDLCNKFLYKYDPFLNYKLGYRIPLSHGTYVASFAAAETNGGGRLASTGFNSSLIGFLWIDGVAAADYASNVMKVDVINISWSIQSMCGGLNIDSNLIHKIKKILDNGTIVVEAAGNGNYARYCNGGPVYPFSPMIDPRIICVTSTGSTDKHGPNQGAGVGSGYPAVSICAPGYNVVSATTLYSTNGTKNLYPYSLMSGTSLAAPIVAGVCALMKSIDPCLNSERAKALIQATADPVQDADLYPNMLGAGRINAYKAVMATGTKSANGTMVSGIYSAGYAANLTDLSIQNNSNIIISTRKELNIKGSFDAPMGVSLNFSIDADAVNSCNW